MGRGSCIKFFNFIFPTKYAITNMVVKFPVKLPSACGIVSSEKESSEPPPITETNATLPPNGISPFSYKTVNGIANSIILLFEEIVDSSMIF